MEKDFFNSSLLTIHPFHNFLLEISCSLLAILEHLHNTYFIRDTLFLLICLYHQNFHPHFFVIFFTFFSFNQATNSSQLLDLPPPLQGNKYLSLNYLFHYIFLYKTNLVFDIYKYIYIYIYLYIFFN